MGAIFGQTLEALEFEALEILAPELAERLAFHRQRLGDPTLAIDQIESSLGSDSSLVLLLRLSSGDEMTLTLKVDLHVLRCVGNA